MGLQVMGAVGIVHLAVHHRVFEGAAVLGNEQRRHRVIGVQAQQQLGQSLGIDFPVHFCEFQPALSHVPRAIGAYHGARVVVDAQVVQGRSDDVHVASLHLRRVGAQVGQYIGRVGSLEQRINIPTHQPSVFQTRFCLVGGAVRGALDGREVEHNAQAGFAAHVAQRAQGHAVAEQQVVRYLRGRGPAFDARGEDAALVAQHRHHPGFVVGGHGRYPVAQAGMHTQGIVDKVLHRVAMGPAALVLQGLRQVPVVEREVGRNAAREQAVHQSLIKIQALGVPGAAARGLHAGPADRKAVGIHAQAGNHVQVVRPALVMVACHAAVAAVCDGARLFAKAVPNGGSFAVNVGGAFNLKSAGGDTPDKVGWKLRARVGGKVGVHKRQKGSRSENG